MRCGCVNTSKPSARAIADQRDAGRLRHAHRQRGRRRHRDDHRPHPSRRSSAPSRPRRGWSAARCRPSRRRRSRASAPASLSSALWRPTSSRSATRPRAGVQKAAAWTARVSMLSTCSGAQRRQRGHDLLRREAHGRRDDRGAAAAPRRSIRRRTARSRSGRRSAGAARAACSASRLGSHIRSSMPPSCSTMSSDSISSRRSHDAFGEAEADREIFAGRAASPSSRHGCRRYRSARPAVSSGTRARAVADAGRRARRLRATLRTGVVHRLLRGLGRDGDAARLPRLLVIVLLPVGRPVRRRDLHRRHLVFRAVGRPVRIVGGDDVGLRRRDGGTSCRPRPARRGR